MSDFKRENRYLVLKMKDIEKYLTIEDQKELMDLAYVISMSRAKDKKEELNCVVVEKRWPEYEPTWKAIEERMSQT